MLAVITVDTFDDTIDFNDGLTSLREAIFSSNLFPGEDEIQFKFGSNSPRTIMLTQGEVVIADDLRVTGPGADRLTIDASGSDPTPDEDLGDGSRVFRIDDGDQDTFIDVTISGMTLTGGDATTGGAIAFQENLALESVWIKNNVAVFGGGISSTGPTFQTTELATLRIANSTISGNSARMEFGDRDPIGGYFGGVQAHGVNTLLSNSTISGNVARGCGGIRLGGESQIIHSTITANTGMGLCTWWDQPIHIRNSVIAGNGHVDVYANGGVEAEFSLLGHVYSDVSLEAPLGAPDANGNLIGGPVHGAIDPLLAPLADNGGAMPTHALLETSPALNAGDPSLQIGSPDVPDFDQRGTPFPRVMGRIDMGAYEVRSLVVDTLVDEHDGDFSSGDLSLREAIALANESPGADVISFAPSVLGTIVLTLGELTISDKASVMGPGADLLTIDASGSDPTPDEDNGDGSGVLVVHGSALELSGLTLTGGDSRSKGAAIRSSGSLALVDTAITGNSSGEAGGGIYSRWGDVTISESIIAGNTTTGDSAAGGGVHVRDGSLTIDRSIVSENATRGLRSYGGGIAVFASDLIIQSSQILSNETSGISAYGGGVYSGRESRTPTGSVSIVASEVKYNVASGSGGGVYRTGFGLDVSDSTIEDNSSSDYGGGIAFFNLFPPRAVAVSESSATPQGEAEPSALRIQRSIVRGNQAGANGGGLHAYNGQGDVELSVVDCTFAENHADGDGGGVDLSTRVQLAMVNSTISGNSSDHHGGGVFVDTDGQSHALTHSTITGNTANRDESGDGSGGGLFVRQGEVRLDHSVIAQNRVEGNLGPDITGVLGAIISPRFSLIGNNNVSGLAESPDGLPDEDGNLIGGPLHGVLHPRLGALAMHGGPVPTRVALANSPVIDAGDPLAITGTGGVPEFDQRGGPFLRVFGGRPDIGATELQTLPPNLELVVDSWLDESDGDYSSGDLTLREAVGLANGSPGHHVVSFAAELDGKTVSLTQGEIRIVSDVEINASHLPAGFTLDASGSDPTPHEKNGDGSGLFNISTFFVRADVKLVGLTLIGEDSGENGAAVRSSETLSVVGSTIRGNHGHGILSDGYGAQLNVVDSTISDNMGTGVQAIRDYASVAGSRIENNGAAGVVIFRGSLAVSDTVISGNMTEGGIKSYGSVLSVSETVIRDNHSTGDGGGILSDHDELDLVDNTIQGNSSDACGGGVFADNTELNVMTSTIQGNHAATDGGGICVASSSSRDFDATIIGSSIVGNSADGQGGGIYNIYRSLLGEHNLTVTQSTISGNTAESGGGIHHASGRLSIVNTTISQNAASDAGGGIFDGNGRTRITHSSITENSSTMGAGIARSQAELFNGTLIGSSIVAGNLGPDITRFDVSVTMFSLGYNLIGTGNALDQFMNHDIVGVTNPLLGPLTDNGGPTRTHAPLRNSPAIDAGNPQAVVDVYGIPKFDQRRAPWIRIVDGNRDGTAIIDIGALESLYLPPQLPGDYNLDGLVDSADFSVWRDSLGQSGLGLPADGNGNGTVDSADYSIWKSNFGNTLSATPAATDAAYASFESTGRVRALRTIDSSKGIRARPRAHERMTRDRWSARDLALAALNDRQTVGKTEVSSSMS